MLKNYVAVKILSHSYRGRGARYSNDGKRASTHVCVRGKYCVLKTIKACSYEVTIGHRGLLDSHLASVTGEIKLQRGGGGRGGAESRESRGS